MRHDDDVKGPVAGDLEVLSKRSGGRGLPVETLDDLALYIG